MTDVARLRRTLGAPELERLLSRLVRRIELGQDLYAPIVLATPSDAERRAVAGLLGRRNRQGAGSLNVRPELIQAVLREAGICDDLRTAVHGLVGHIPVRAETLADEDMARAGILATLSDGRHAGELWMADWLDSLSADGTLTRLVRQGGTGQARHVRAVLDLLPADPAPLTVIAERATGDTKALSGSPLARLVLRALAWRAGESAPVTAAERRALWESAGVIVDDLASQVLVLGLTAEGSALAEWLSSAARHRIPFRVTLHQLDTMPVTVTSPVVYVCENPAVLRAAAGIPGAALICTEGIPSIACHRLLAACSGRPVHWRGDFDWTGLRTTAEAITRYGATAWRMDLETYDRALSGGESEPLRGSRSGSPWELGLAERMARTGRAVMEERLIPGLLADLRSAGGWGSGT
ncbi:TIGR02679 family protein [Nonomuraea sp. NPDC048916]|uniref:TIGR02679 family protein n=1 Tax=Nonomuraea sp. NPDC048916 TaxID=3154232 RepID=UPI0034015836